MFWSHICARKFINYLKPFGSISLDHRKWKKKKNFFQQRFRRVFSFLRDKYFNDGKYLLTGFYMIGSSVLKELINELVRTWMKVGGLRGKWEKLLSETQQWRLGKRHAWCFYAFILLFCTFALIIMHVAPMS